MLAAGVAEERGAPRLVERGPGVDPVAERVVHVAGVVGEAVRGVAVRPAAPLLERLRQVPVVQREPGQDARPEQLVDEARVEVDALRVDRAAVGRTRDHDVEKR